MDEINGNAGNCTTLFAGQTIDAGDVCVTIDGDNLVVTYTTKDGWLLQETHLWVGEDLEDMPQTRKGNPKIGNFPYKAEDINDTSFSFTIPLGSVIDGFTDACQFCGDGAPSLPQIYVAAHAAVYKVNDDGTTQTETGWGDGDPIVDRGSWATVSTISLDVICDVEPPNPGVLCDETAFAYADANGTCFLNIDEDDDGNGDFNRWGWSIGPLDAGDHVFDIYAGAGQCDISKGTLVGRLEVSYDGSEATVRFVADAGFSFDETHLYVGNEILPRDVNGDFTVAPGQYPHIHDLDEATSDTFVVDGLSGQIYIVAHSVALSADFCEE